MSPQRRSDKPPTTEERCALDLARSLFPAGKAVIVDRDGCARRGYCLTNQEPVVDSPHGPLVRYTCMRGGHFHVCIVADAKPA